MSLMKLVYMKTGLPVKHGDKLRFKYINEKVKLKYKVESFEPYREGKDAYVKLKRDVQDILSFEITVPASSIAAHWVVS